MIKKQLVVLKTLINILNENKKINIKEYDKENNIFIKSLNLISNKPLLYICNVDEKSVVSGNKFSNIVKEIASNEKNESVIISAVVESQISEFKDKEEKLMILKDLGLQKTTLNKVIKAGYDLLDLITFFTSGPKETRAWTIIKDTKVSIAAGKIHSDFEKGFIRAETISYNDFINNKGWVNSKNIGKMRLEGKEYIVKDGDVLNFRFNT